MQECRTRATFGSSDVHHLPAMLMDPHLRRRIEDPLRLSALDATGLLDTLPEPSFDRLTRLASHFLRAPLSLVNLVDDRRQFAKSCFAPEGWPDSREAPLPDSYCKWVVAECDVVAIDDARSDPRVSDSAILGDLGVVTYLGVPLTTGDGFTVGTLCVAGFAPRHWTADEIRVLCDLAASVVTEIELRRDLRQREVVERFKDELVSVVSHELRTPLTSIRGSLGLLASGRLGDLSPQGQRMVEIAAQNTDRLVRLINDMLDLERLRSGAVALERHRVEARDLVERATEALDGTARQAGVALETEVPAALPLDADPDRVVQVLVNLISNAVKFSPRGAAVRVVAEPRGPEVLFQVRDRGRGIPQDQLENVFERFRQVDSSDARDHGGTGLGLAITRGIVQQHGGRIWVASEPGAGSTFFFTLPTGNEE